MSNNPFASYKPSLFVVSSPFQALCAVSAIKNLCIKDYRFFIVTTGGKRDCQQKTFLDQMGIVYEPYRLSKVHLILDIVKVLLGVRGKYQRAFIGDFSASFMLGIALPYMEKGADAVYLDDGNSVISLFKNTFNSWDNKHSQFVYGFLVKMRQVKPLNYFYTIYSDICNSKFQLQNNDISVLLNSDYSNKTKENIVFIGTSKSSYCSQLELSADNYFEQIRNVFLLIKERFPKEKIIYIPHGNDKSEYAQQLCDEFGGQFIRVDTMVENYLLGTTWVPKALFGLSSTALLNMKRINPFMPVVNILFYGNENCSRLGKYKSIFAYYKENNIECIEWKV